MQAKPLKNKFEKTNPDMFFVGIFVCCEISRRRFLFFFAKSDSTTTGG